MPGKTLQSSSLSAGQRRATPLSQDLSPELLQELSELGIDPALARQALEPQFVGISSASGPAEHQAEIDAWINAGGDPLNPA